MGLKDPGIGPPTPAHLTPIHTVTHTHTENSHLIQTSWSWQHIETSITNKVDTDQTVAV